MDIEIFEGLGASRLKNEVEKKRQKMRESRTIANETDTRFEIKVSRSEIYK